MINRHRHSFGGGQSYGDALTGRQIDGVPVDVSRSIDGSRDSVADTKLPSVIGVFMLNQGAYTLQRDLSLNVEPLSNLNKPRSSVAALGGRTILVGQAILDS